MKSEWENTMAKLLRTLAVSFERLSNQTKKIAELEARIKKLEEAV